MLSLRVVIAVSPTLPGRQQVIKSYFLLDSGVCDFSSDNVNLYPFTLINHKHGSNSFYFCSSFWQIIETEDGPGEPSTITLQLLIRIPRKGIN